MLSANTRRRHRQWIGRWASSGVAVWAVLRTPMVEARNLSEETRVKLEALQRLKGMDLSAHPALEEAVGKIAAQARGEPEWVGLVRDFHLRGQEAALAEYVAKYPEQPAAIDALRLLLDEPETPTLSRLLSPPTERRIAIIQSLGATLDHRMVGLLAPLILKSTESLEIRRAAVAALTGINEGARELLSLVETGKLPADLKSPAGAGLRTVRWPELRKQAERLFPAESAPAKPALPPIAELVKLPGDPDRGALVFRRADVGCINCHQVNGEGVNFGPALSEIGTKLGKDALCVAILEPSAGIAFGYEAWSFEFKGGDEAFGLIASETEEEIAIKVAGGLVAKYKKSEIVKREKQALSIMPAGLQENMSTQDFVDLINYLASLKKANH